jgi:hypothetical protein
VPDIPAYRRISARISTYIRLRSPKRDHPSHRSSLRNWPARVRNEPLDRTQEVGGSNPPSSIESKALQTATSDSGVSFEPSGNSPSFQALVPETHRICGDMRRFRAIPTCAGHWPAISPTAAAPHQAGIARRRISGSRSYTFGGQPLQDAYASPFSMPPSKPDQNQKRTREPPGPTAPERLVSSARRRRAREGSPPEGDAPSPVPVAPRNWGAQETTGHIDSIGRPASSARSGRMDCRWRARR